MDCISNDEARQMHANRTSDKVAELEDKVDILAIQVDKVQKQLEQIVNAIKVVQCKAITF